MPAQAAKQTQRGEGKPVIKPSAICRVTSDRRCESIINTTNLRRRRRSPPRPAQPSSTTNGMKWTSLKRCPMRGSRPEQHSRRDARILNLHLCDATDTVPTKYIICPFVPTKTNPHAGRDAKIKMVRGRFVDQKDNHLSLLDPTPWPKR